MKKVFFLFGLLHCYTTWTQQPFQSLENIQLIQSDLHTHSVFSDGSVWPDIRIQEALKEGLDLIAITEHLEYQPHQADIPHPDRNRSFELAQGYGQGHKNLHIINGAEITRDMPPGHINAVFIEDANKILQKDSLSGIEAANAQKGFVFWNHPTWDAQRPDGIARLDPFHKYLIDRKLLHGIEVVNELTFSEEAFQLALDNQLTILGTSDIHGLTDWLFDIPNGGHRPTTFVLSRSKKVTDIKNALFEGRTVVWFQDLLLGKEENIQPVLTANLKATTSGYGKENVIVKVELENKSALPMILVYQGPFSFYKNSRTITIPPFQKKQLEIKTQKKRQNLSLPFTVNNVLVGPRQPAQIEFKFALK